MCLTSLLDRTSSGRIRNSHTTSHSTISARISIYVSIRSSQVYSSLVIRYSFVRILGKLLPYRLDQARAEALVNHKPRHIRRRTYIAEEENAVQIHWPVNIEHKNAVGMPLGPASLIASCTPLVFRRIFDSVRKPSLRG